MATLTEEPSPQKAPSPGEKKPEKMLPPVQRLLPVDEVVKRRALLIAQLETYGKERGIQHGTEAGTAVQKALARELGVPDGYVAALYFSKEEGAIQKDGLVRGLIRRLEDKDLQSSGVPFVVDSKHLSGKGSITFTLDGRNIDTDRARPIMPALVDRQPLVETSFFAYSKNDSNPKNDRIVIRFDEMPIPAEGRGRSQFDQNVVVRVYINGKPLPDMQSLSEAQSGESAETWTGADADGTTHTVVAKVKTELQKYGNSPKRIYSSVKFDGKELQIWKD